MKLVRHQNFHTADGYRADPGHQSGSTMYFVMGAAQAVYKLVLQ
jgi:hypothetical protein